MTFDDQKNNLYYQALKEAVNPQSVVLDLGAGLGLHGMMAAKLGAKRVYLIDPSIIINEAAQLVEANNLADRVTCIQGKIEDVQLPEKVDIIVSALTGNFLLSEDLLHSLFYARNSYLKNGGHMIPDCAQMEAVPLNSPAIYSRTVGSWSKDYFDLDFSRPRNQAANTVYYFDRLKQCASEFMAKPEILTNIDFTVASEASCIANVEFVSQKNAECHGILGWFNARLGQKWLSTSPAEPKTHWTPAFLPIDPPVTLASGDVMEFYLARPQKSEWTWRISSNGNKQQFSTFNRGQHS